MTKLLVNAKAGIEHLSDRLVSVKVPDGTRLEMTDETVLEVLLQCEQKLLRLVDAAEDNVGKREEEGEDGGVDQAPHNVRVALSDVDDDSESDLEEEGEEEDTPMDRALLKEHANSAVSSPQSSVQCLGFRV